VKNLLFAVALLLLTIPCSAEIIIVDNDWPYDFDNIQAAIDYASDGDFIFVFPGTYTGPGNRDIDFRDKAITVRSIDPTDPYFVAQTIIDCNDLGHGFYFDSGEEANSVLAGFTITNGFADTPEGVITCFNSSPTITNCTISDNNSRGIFCYHSNSVITSCTVSDNRSGISCDGNSPTITNCTVSDNNGGGIYCYRSRPVITNCTVSDNNSIGIWCMDDCNVTIINSTITGNMSEAPPHFGNGGGICCTDLSSLAIINSTIAGNTGDTGGGIYCGYQSSLEVNACVITGNSAMDSGGGIYCDPISTSQTITSCTITGNSARNFGGGIYCEHEVVTKIASCTIAGNLAQTYGGGIFCMSSKALINGSIFWGNSDISGQGQSAQVYDNGQTPNVWFSCIQDDNPNDAYVPFDANNFNIDDDPCFVAPGFWDANVWHDGDYHLLPASPCIETGDPYYTYHAGDVDIDGQPRLMGQRVDMGADEFELKMIVVDKPKGGEVWAAGSTHEIKWDSYNITGTVDITCLRQTPIWVILPIDVNVPDTGSYTWNIPSDFDGNWYIITVAPSIHVPDPNLICVGSDFFSIWPYSPGPPVEPKWKSLGGNFDRSGLSQDSGPELGCVKWQFQTNGPVSASPTVGADGRVHLACEDGKLYTLDANGQLLWSYDTNSPLLSSPSIGPDGSVFVGAENGMLYVIDVNGILRWTHSTDSFIYSSPAISADGNIFVCSQDGLLYSLGRDGSELWTFETGGVSPVPTGAVFASPTIGPNSTIYITGAYKPYLYAIDSNTGSLKWICDFSNPTTSGRAPWPFASPVIAENGTIYQTLLYDPNLYAITSQLIPEGEFITTSGVSDNFIAAWGNNIWRPLGSGMNNSVYALTVYDGKLAAGGNFTQAGGVLFADGIAAWTGRYWQSLEELGGPVYALTVYNSQLIAGGNLYKHIARLNGYIWEPLGNGTNDVVRALAVYNGLLIAGGDFTTAGGISANHIATWDGSSWLPLGNGMNGSVHALMVYDGLLVAGGEFTTADGEPAKYIAAWDSDNWWPLGLGMDYVGGVHALTVYDGMLIAGGYFRTADGLDANNIAAWNGSSWQALGSGVDHDVLALSVYNGELIAGGSFWSAGGVDANHIAAWNGSSWQPLRNGTNDVVRALTVYDGLLVAGGEFTTANSGSVTWSVNLADPCYPSKYGWSEPALAPDGTIYVSFDDPYLRAVDPNGSIKWVTRLGMVGGFTLTVGSDGLIYATSDDSCLCVIDPNGKEIARFKGDNWLSSPVITADNTIIVCDSNNTVWALGGSGCEGQSAALHRPQDLSEDWSVSFNDFALIANDWLKFNCYASDELPPCDKYPDEGFYYTGDIDRDLYVDFADIAELADKWLSQE
jgi:parallel beta-helix repeat protein/predicted outer membrane repeat protein